MGRQSKSRVWQLRRAAHRLGVNVGTLQAQGWRRAPDERVERVLAEQPEWLTRARKKEATKHRRRLQRGNRRAMAAELGISLNAVRSNNVEPGQLAGLLAAPPPWLVAARQQHKANQARLAHERAQAAAKAVWEGEVDEAWLRAYKDGGDTDLWAAGVLHTAGIHTLDLGEPEGTVPITPTADECYAALLAGG